MKLQKICHCWDTVSASTWHCWSSWRISCHRGSTSPLVVASDHLHTLPVTKVVLCSRAPRILGLILKSCRRKPRCKTVGRWDERICLNACYDNEGCTRGQAFDFVTDCLGSCSTKKAKMMLISRIKHKQPEVLRHPSQQIEEHGLWPPRLLSTIPRKHMGEIREYFSDTFKPWQPHK